MPIQTVSAYLRRNWQIIAISILVLGAGVSIATQLVINARETAERRDQLCAAIPNAAAAGADALIDTAIVQARKRNAPEAEIRRLRTVGALYAGHARYLVLHRYLPFCPQVKDPLAPPTKEP